MDWTSSSLGLLRPSRLTPAHPPSIGAISGASLQAPALAPPSLTLFPPAPASPGIQARVNVFTHPQAWNREKHADRVVDDLSKPNVVIEVNDQGGNVNVRSNPGFWTHVVKPTFCQLSEGANLDCSGSSFHLSTVTYQKEAAGTESGCILRFEFSSLGLKSAITVTLHHGTRNVQLQGHLVMPNQDRSALWFVKNILDPYFLALAKKKQLDISECHAAILAMASCKPAPAARKSSTGGSRIPCQGCGKCLKGNTAFPCAAGRCQLVLHKKCAAISGRFSHTCHVPFCPSPAPALSQLSLPSILPPAFPLFHTPHITQPLTLPPSVTPPANEPVTPPVTQPLTSPIIQPLTHPVTHPLTSPITQPLTHSITQPPTHSVTQPLIPPVTQPLTFTVTTLTTSLPSTVMSLLPSHPALSDALPALSRKRLAQNQTING